MRKRWSRMAWMIASALTVCALSWTQTSFDLRTRIVNAHDNVPMTDALVFEDMEGMFPSVRVIGTSDGRLLFYGISSQGQVTRIGRATLPDEIRDLAGFSYLTTINDANRAVFFAAVSGSVVCLGGYDAVSRTIAPLGQIPNLSAARIAIRWEGMSTNPTVVLAAGGTNGVVSIYRFGVGLPATPWSNPANVGSPVQQLVLPVNNRVASIRFSGTDLFVASGRAVYRYVLQNNQYVPAGKDMRTFSPIAEMTITENYVVAAAEDGYVYAWARSNGAFAGMLKERYNTLSAHTLCALPSNRVAVGYNSVRVYQLPNFEQIGELGIPPSAGILREAYYRDWWAHYGVPFYDNRSSVLPAWCSNALLPIGVKERDRIRSVMFVALPGLYRRIPAPQSRAPVYGLVMLWVGSTFQLAAGYADGVVRVYDAINGAPISQLNVQAPVFALAGVIINNQPWWLISVGALGQVIAWNSATNQVVNVINNPQGVARIYYGLRVQAVSGNVVTFWTASSDGKLEKWQVPLPGGAAAPMLSLQVMNGPLWSLSVHPNGAAVAGGLSGARYYPGSGTTWYSVPTNPDPLNHRCYSVAIHPNNPFTFAIALNGWSEYPYYRPSSIYLYTYDDSFVPPRFNPFTLERLINPHITLLSWLSDTKLAAADLDGDRIYIYNTSLRSLYDRQVFARPEYASGAWDQNPVRCYEPIRNGATAFSVQGNALFVGSASGEIALLGDINPAFTTYYLSPVTTIDFLPANGDVVYQGRILSGNLNNPLHIPYPASDYTRYNPFAGKASTQQQNRIVGFGWGVTLDFGGNPPVPITVSYQTWGLPICHDISEDGRYGAFQKQNGISGNQWTINVEVRDLHNSPTSALPILSTQWPWTSINHLTTNGYTVAVAHSGSQVRLAMTTYLPSMVSNEVQIYTYDGRAWSLTGSITLPTRPLNFITYRAIRFVDFNRLLAAYPDGNPLTWRLALYVWNGSQWQLAGSPVDTTLAYLVPGGYGRFLDVVSPSASNPRVAFSNFLDGLVLYKLVGNSLQLVAQSTISSSGYLEGGYYDWVRFSRYDPNRLGLASWRSPSALIVDLSGLPW